MTFFVTLDGVQGAILTYDLRIVLSFDHRVCFLMNIFGKRSILPFFTRAIPRRRKAWFHLRMSRILFAAKHSWTTLRISRPLFVGS